MYMETWRLYCEDRGHIFVLICQYDVVVFNFVFVTEINPYTEDIYYNYVDCIRERAFK